MKKISTFSGVITIVIIAAVVGAFIYFEIEEASPSSVVQPISVDKIKETIVEKKESACETEKESEIALPVVRFIPGTFSDGEKKDLMDMVVNPFIDFEKDSYAQNRIISIAVNKYSDSELADMQDPKYMYNINVIYEEGYGGWIERKVGELIDYWIPDCLGECEFSDEFKEKYPEIIEKYNEIQNPEE